MSREERLRAHVDAVADRDVVWGRDDCSAWAAAWVRAETGLAVPLPHYGDRDSAEALIAAAGGLVALWSEAIPELERTAFHEAGDVGVVETRLGAVGVVFAHGGFALWRAARGVLPFVPRASAIFAAWSVPAR